MSNTRLVLDFIAAWHQRDLAAILGHLTPDCHYHNIPMEPWIGTEAIKAGLAPFLAMSDEIEWIVHHIGTSPSGVVLTERTDRFRMGGKWVEIRVMGTFEFRDGRIAAWRDYFDLAEFQRQMAA